MGHNLLISIIIASAGIVALELGASVAMLEIIGGVLAHNVFGVESDIAWLQFLAHLGLIGIMFLAGFEIDLRIVRRFYKRSLVTALLSFLLPLTAVSVVALLLFSFPLKTALLLGIALSTTSLALVYPLLKKTRLLEEEAGQILFASAMLVDIFSMLALGALFAEPLSILAFVLIFALVLSGLALPKIGKFLFSRYRQKEESAMIEFELRFVLFILIGIAFMAEHIPNVHAPVIAFLFGMMLAEMFPNDEPAEQKLRSVIFGFLAPFFFFSAGLRAEFSTFGLSMLWMLAVFSTVAFAAKFFGTFFAIKQYYSTLATYAGTIFNLRLSFGMIAALIGLENGLLDRTTYTMVVLSLIALSIVATVRTPKLEKIN